MTVLIILAIAVLIFAVARSSARSKAGRSTAAPRRPYATPESRPAEPPRALNTFSHSRLEKFEKCPKAYEFRYIRNVPESFGTIETFLGRTVHSTLEWAYAERDRRGAPPGIKELEAHFQGLWAAGNSQEMRVVKKAMSAGTYKAQGLEMLKAFERRILAGDKTQTIALEKQFRMALSGGAAFTGVIDRLARDEAGMVYVIDYKTGSSRNVTAPAQSRQLQVYGAWAAEDHGATRIGLRVEDMQGERTLSHTWTTASRSTLISGLEAQIAEVGRARRFPAVTSPLCGWCGYRPHCSEGRARWGA